MDWDHYVLILLLYIFYYKGSVSNDEDTRMLNILSEQQEIHRLIALSDAEAITERTLEPLDSKESATFLRLLRKLA